MDWALVTTIVVGLLLVVDVAIRVIAIITVPINRRPQTATAWLLAIFFIPYLGFLLFLLFGSTKLPRKRRDRQSAINTYILETTAGTERVRRDDAGPPWLPPIVELNRTLGAMPLVGGNTATLTTSYNDTILELARAVDDAERYVHAEFYILSLDR